VKNILNQKPNLDLNGRLQYACDFVEQEDIKNKNMLDIGCGYGWFEKNAIKCEVNEIMATEISNDDLRTVKENIKDIKLKTCVASAIALPFPDNVFDTVVS